MCWLSCINVPVWPPVLHCSGWTCCDWKLFSASCCCRLKVLAKLKLNQYDTNCLCSCWTFTWQSDLPLFVVGIAVAVVLGVSAVPVDATGTFLDARPWAPPVEVLLAAPTHPPRVGGPIWGANTDTHKQKTVCELLSRKSKVMSAPVSFWQSSLCLPQKNTAETKTQTFVEAIKLCH